MENTINNLDLFGLLRVGIMLLAFLIAFYALIARERKSPLLISSMFYATYGLLILLIIALVANINGIYGTNNILLIVLVFFVIFINYHILKVHNKVKNLRSDHEFKNSWVLRTIKDLKRRQQKGRTYEHYTSNIGPTLSGKILESDYVPLKQKDQNNDSLKLPITAIYHLSSHRESDEVLVDLASRFIENKKWVQYTSCTRHPVEFLSALKSYLEKSKSENDWEKQSKRIVVVDACTPHFGFTDSIYAVRSDDAKKMCLEFIKAPPSFSGIHTAAARAFNLIKQNSDGTREPTLVIYEGLHSLVDLESEAQYRIFYSHVLPSERLWGGMFTVVIEFSPSNQNLDHIRTYGDYCYVTTHRCDGYPKDNNEDTSDLTIYTNEKRKNSK